MTTWINALQDLIRRNDSRMTREEILERIKEEKWSEQLVTQRLRTLVSEGKIIMLGEQDLNRIGQRDEKGNLIGNVHFRTPP